MRKKKEPVIDTNNWDKFDFSKLHENFYSIDKEDMLDYKPLHKRLSEGYINYSRLKDDIDFYEKAMRYLTRTAFGLFNYITKEKYPNIVFNVKSFTSFCGLVENRVQVGAKLLTLKGIPRNEKVDIIASDIYHEFYHKLFTNNDIRIETALKKGEEYYKNPAVDEYIKKNLMYDETIKNIFNILEDKRIEAMGSELYPGYAFFLESSRKYAHYLHSKKKFMPPYYIYILDYLATKILAPELIDNFWKDFDKALSVIVAGFVKLQQGLLDELLKDDDGSEDIKSKIEEQKKVLAEAQEKYRISEEEHTEVSNVINKMDKYIESHKDLVFSFDYKEILTAGKALHDLIPKKALEELNKAITERTGFIKMSEEMGGEAFNFEEGEDLDSETTKFLDDVVSDELDKLNKEAEDAMKKNNAEKKHTEKINSKNNFSYYEYFEIIEEAIQPIDIELYSEAKKISKNICNNLGFLDSRYVRNIENYELSEGELDDTELYSVSFNNKNIFEEVEDFPSYSLDFGILLDESGSMCGRIREAKLATLSMLLGLKDNKHINMFVYGHTANDSSSKAIQIYKYYNTLKKEIDYRRIFSAKSRSNNADGFAIEKVAEFMKESTSKEKILVVVSDGQPSASGYGGAQAEAHVKSVVDSLEADGITVIQVCMDYIENSPRMFNHYVPYSKDGVFFDNLKKILMTKLNQFADNI